MTLLIGAIAVGVALGRGSFASPGALVLLAVLAVPGVLVDLLVLAAWRRGADENDDPDGRGR